MNQIEPETSMTKEVSGSIISPLIDSYGFRWFLQWYGCSSIV